MVIKLGNKLNIQSQRFEAGGGWGAIPHHVWKVVYDVLWAINHWKNIQCVHSTKKLYTYISIYCLN